MAFVFIWLVFIVENISHFEYRCFS